MKYLYDIKNYKSKSLRIDGFGKPARIGLFTPSPMRVVSHDVFQYYKENKQLPDEFVSEVKEFWEIAKLQNPNRDLYIGRGFYVPGVEYPPGPRTAGINDFNVYIKEIPKFYKFVIDSKFDIEGSEIELILHPFIHPYKPPLQDSPEVPFPGGAVTPSKNDNNHAIIEAIWGHDEAIQTLPHDTYIVDYKKMIIIEKRIQKKESSLKAVEGNKYIEVDIPPSHQGIQCLNDLQILQIAQDFQKVEKEYGNHRIEFILQEEGIVYRECTKFKHEPDLQISANVKGVVKVIKTLNDVSNYENSESNIVYIHSSVIKDRNMDILTTLAIQNKSQLIVLYPGTVTTSHAATIFRELGHVLVHVGNEVYKNNEEVEIKLKDGELVAQKTEDLKELAVVEFKDLDTINPVKIGSKAYRLFELKKFGFVVPAIVVISTDIFRKMRKNSQICKYISDIDSLIDIELIKEKCEYLKGSIKNYVFPKSVEKKIMKSIKKMRQGLFSVRSSANCEDSNNSSFAGQFDSILNVDTDNVLNSIKQVWASTFNLNSVLYAKNKGIDIMSIEMAVIVQEMIHAQKAGVVFSKNPINNKFDEIIIDATNGLGDKIVDGLVDSDRVIINSDSERLLKEKG